MNKNSKKNSFLHAIPIVSFVVFPVLIVRLQYVAVAPDATNYWSDNFVGDTRSWWKAVVVVGVGMWMLCHFITLLIARWQPRFLFFAGLIINAIVVTLLSALFSEYPFTSWLGYTTSFEGAFVLFSYCIGIYYTAETADSEMLRLMLVRLVGCVGLLNALHGIAEGFGWHFWQTEAGRWIMGSQNVENILFRFSDSRMAYGTVFQPNHYGMLMAMVLSIAIAMINCEKIYLWKIFWGVTFVSSLVAVLFSNSRSGILVSLIIIVFYQLRIVIDKIRKISMKSNIGGKKKNIPWILYIAIIVAFTIPFSIQEIRTAFFRFVDRISLSYAHESFDFPVKALELNSNCILLGFENKDMFLWKDTPTSWRTAWSTDSRSYKLIAKDDETGWRIAALPEISDVFLSWNSHGNVQLFGQGMDVSFYSIGTRIYAVDKACEQLRSKIAVAQYSPNGYEKLMSGRGYIWSSILPLISRAPWFGSGPGSFVFVFPNDDLLNKQRFTNGLNEDKGHGLWAMLLVQLGIIGIISYCLPIAYCILYSYRKAGLMRTPLLLGMAAYLCCGLANDSTVGVTPIFCVITGLALADASVIRDNAESV